MKAYTLEILAVVFGVMIGVTVAKATVSTDIGPFMYVFDEKEQLWNRATAEMLKNAKCEHLREYFRK